MLFGFEGGGIRVRFAWPLPVISTPISGSQGAVLVARPAFRLVVPLVNVGACQPESALASGVGACQPTDGVSAFVPESGTHSGVGARVCIGVGVCQPRSRDFWWRERHQTRIRGVAGAGALWKTTRDIRTTQQDKLCQVFLWICPRLVSILRYRQLVIRIGPWCLLPTAVGFDM